MRRARKKCGKEHRISLRLSERDLAVIDRAARLLGCSRTDFVREAAVRAAEEVLLERGLIRMSAEGFGAFAAAIAAPAKPVPATVEALKRPAPWNKGGPR